MRAIKALGIIVAGVVLTLLVAGILLPTSYHVERSVQIAAPARVVWPLVADLRHHASWSPWKAADPTMVMSFPGETTGDGAVYTWTGDRSGTGTFTIVTTDAPRRIDSTVEFDGVAKATGSITLEPSGEGTRVTWAIDGEDRTPVTGPWVALTMDGMLGPDFEDGLRRLARVAEEAARTVPSPHPTPAGAAAQATASPTGAAAPPPVQ